MKKLSKALKRAVERRRAKKVKELSKLSQEARIAALKAELEAGVTPEQAERDKRFLEEQDDQNDNGTK